MKTIYGTAGIVFLAILLSASISQSYAASDLLSSIAQVNDGNSSNDAGEAAAMAVGEEIGSRVARHLSGGDPVAAVVGGFMGKMAAKDAVQKTQGQ